MLCCKSNEAVETTTKAPEEPVKPSASDEAKTENASVDTPPAEPTEEKVEDKEAAPEEETKPEEEPKAEEEDATSKAATEVEAVPSEADTKGASTTAEGEEGTVVTEAEALKEAEEKGYKCCGLY